MLDHEMRALVGKRVTFEINPDWEKFSSDNNPNWIRGVVKEIAPDLDPNLRAQSGTLQVRLTDVEFGTVAMGLDSTGMRNENCCWPLPMFVKVLRLDD